MKLKYIIPIFCLIVLCGAGCVKVKVIETEKTIIKEIVINPIQFLGDYDEIWLHRSVRCINGCRNTFNGYKLEITKNGTTKEFWAKTLDSLFINAGNWVRIHPNAFEN